MSPPDPTPVWSPEYPFDKEHIRKHAPQSAGVYELLQSLRYHRYMGVTRTLKIGYSRKSLRRELSNHLHGHAAANRLARARKRPNVQVSFRFVVTEPQSSKTTEKALLQGFEDAHWELPLLNAQRGHKRGKDRHYRGSPSAKASEKTDVPGANQ